MSDAFTLQLHSTTGDKAHLHGAVQCCLSTEGRKDTIRLFTFDDFHHELWGDWQEVNAVRHAWWQRKQEDPCQLAQVGSYNNICQYKILRKGRKEFTYILLLHVHYNIWRYHFIFLYIYINWKTYWPSLDHSCRNRHLNLPFSPAEVCTVAMLGLINTDITPASCGCAKRVPPNATIPENDTALTIKGFRLQVRKQPLPTPKFVQL